MPVTTEYTIQVNGELQEVAAGATLADVVAQLGLPPERLAIELNRVIVKRELWMSTRVTAGAEIEIVQFVGGG